MYFERKIYITNKPLIITNSAENYIQQHAIAAGYLFLTGAFHRNLVIAQKHLQRPTSLGVIIEDISKDALIEMLHQNYTEIDAAGGIVHNEDGEILMIFRRGKWDLPKGKRDEGESVEACALREVKEETGLVNLSLNTLAAETYHVYNQHKLNVIKHTYWYKMDCPKSDKLVPQLEENIIEAKWIAENRLGIYLRQSYEAVREVIKASEKKHSK